MSSYNSQDTSGLIDIFESAVADGVGTSIDVSAYERIFLQVGSANDGAGDPANLTVKFVGSMSDSAPDFSASRTVTNNFEYIDAIDLEDGASVDGDTGLAFGAANDIRNFEINLGGLHWINAVISSYVAGKLTVKVFGVTR